MIIILFYLGLGLFALPLITCALYGKDGFKSDIGALCIYFLLWPIIYIALCVDYYLEKDVK